MKHISSIRTQLLTAVTIALIAAWPLPALACMASAAPDEVVIADLGQLPDWIALRPGGRLIVAHVPDERIVRPGGGLELQSSAGQTRLVIGSKPDAASQIATLTISSGGTSWKTRIALRLKKDRAPKLIDLRTKGGQAYDIYGGEDFEIVVASEGPFVSLELGGRLKLNPEWSDFDEREKVFRAIFSTRSFEFSSSTTLVARGGTSVPRSFSLRTMSPPRC